MSGHMPLMIDSGAFSAKYRGGVELKLDDYIEFCHVVRETHPHAVFINLDVIREGKKSYDNWISMRKAGLEPLPVFHMGTSTKWAVKYMDGCEHMAISAWSGDKGVSQKRTQSLDRMWRNFFLNRKKEPRIKLHGLALTGFPTLRRYPWYSVDSTSWLQAGQFGFILMPRKGMDGKWDFGRPPTKVGFSTQCAARKEVNKHYDTMSKEEQASMLAYLQSHGKQIGTSKIVKIDKPRKRKNQDVWLDWKEVVIEKGVSNWHGDRSEMSVEFYSAYLREETFPRRYAGPMGGFLDNTLADVPTATSEKKHTILYLSGSAYSIENYLRGKREHDHCGVLLSYYDMKKMSGITWRRLWEMRLNEGQQGKAARNAQDGAPRGNQQGIVGAKQRLRIRRR